jgi:hypothetical protein
VNQTVPVAEATSEEGVLPERVQEALGQLVGAAREGLLALSAGVGLGVLGELMEEELNEVVGSKGRWIPERTAVRHGQAPTPAPPPRIRSCSDLGSLPAGCAGDERRSAGDRRAARSPRPR